MMDSSVERAQRALTLDSKMELLLAVDNEIESLIKKQTRLESSYPRFRSEDTEIELKCIERLLKEKKSRRTFWEELIREASKSTKTVEESVAFRDATADDFSVITGVNRVPKTWTPIVDEHVVPSDSFMTQYEMNCRVWSMNSEASRRTFLDLFLRDVVGRAEFHSALRIFCDLSTTTAPKEVGQQRRKLTGKHEFSIGQAGGADIRDYSMHDKSHIIAVAKNDTDIWQCITEAAALYRIRKDAQKVNCMVWGICSNASLWRFVHIDNNGQIWWTDEMCLHVPSINQAQVLCVYRFVHHVVKSCYLSLPTIAHDRLVGVAQASDLST